MFLQPAQSSTIKCTLSNVPYKTKKTSSFTYFCTQKHLCGCQVHNAEWCHPALLPHHTTLQCNATLDSVHTTTKTASSTAKFINITQANAFFRMSKMMCRNVDNVSSQGMVQAQCHPMWIPLQFPLSDTGLATHLSACTHYAPEWLI